MRTPTVLRVCLFAAGSILLVLACLSPQFRDSENFLKREFALPLAGGFSLLVLASGIGKAWFEASIWLAAAITGQAAALQLVNAGPMLHYQHYTLPAHAPTLLPTLVGIQALAVAAGVMRRFTDIRKWIAANFRLWQFIGIVSASLLFSATVSRDTRFYLAELLLAASIAAVNIGNMVLFAGAIPHPVLRSLRQRFDAWFGVEEPALTEEDRRIDRFAVIGALWIVLLAAALNIFVYERHPHLADEVVYLLHARYLAAGMLTMPLPPIPEAFDIDLMYYATDSWYCPVPPGWPALLAVGVFLKVPWLVNPVLAGLNVLMTYLLLREIYSRWTARLGVVLLATSPWHIFMAMNFMNHTFTMTCLLAAALGVMRSRRTGKRWPAAGAGLATGVMSVIRPLEGLITISVLGLWILGLGGRRLRLAAIAAFLAGTAITGGVGFLYNAAITGDATRAPIMQYTDRYYGAKSNALGFGPERGLGWALDPYPGHSPQESLINANLNLFSLNTELLGWSTGSLILMAVLLFSGSLHRSDYQLLALILIVIGGYSLYWFSGGPDFGARYWYLILPACIALTVGGARALIQKTGPGEPHVLAAVLCLAAMVLINYLPWRAVDKYHHYLQMRPDIRNLARSNRFGKSLVLIRGNRFPDYASAAIYNPLDLRAEATIYAWDKDSEVRTKLLTAYAGRPVWIVNGPSVTQAGFQVIAGPVNAVDLLPQSSPRAETRASLQ